jgi:diaminopimelate epimerase
MGKPNFSPEGIPLLIPDESSVYIIEGYRVGSLSIGNPHCILTLDEIDLIDIETIALKIQNSELLPEQANIGFMEIISSNEINLRVYERGAGETLACGSGACAAVIHGVSIGRLDNKVSVNLRGGVANIEYNQDGHVFLSGPGKFVFEGRIEI